MERKPQQFGLVSMHGNVDTLEIRENGLRIIVE